MANATFIDALFIADKKRTSDGYLAVSAIVARTGIQDYLASELGDDFKDREPRSIVKVFRPESEVFSTDSLSTFAYRPVTNDHPRQAVNSANWRDLSAGVVGPEILRDKEGVRVNMLVMDADTIADIEAGKRELSAGYTAVLDATPGTAPDGQQYDAIQRNIRINHVAVVSRARGGAELRIPDAAQGQSFALCDALPSDLFQPKRKYMEHLTFDGLSVPLDDATAIKSLFDAMKKKMDEKDAEAAEKDKELAAKDAAIADLQTKVIDEAAIDARAAEKADLIARASKIADGLDLKGKTTAEIKKAVVIAKRGTEMADKSDAYIDATFDLLADAVTEPDKLAETVKDGVKVEDAAASARAEYLKRLGIGE